MYPRVRVRETENQVSQVYPRVRVRETEDQVSQVAVAAYLLRVIESLSVDGHELTKSSGANQESREKVYLNKSCVVSSPSSKDSVAPTPIPEGKIRNGSKEDKRNNIRASPIPPPRAVLSSPENDGIIGNQNKRIQERAITVKSQTPDNFGITNRQRSLSRRSYSHAQSNVNDVKAKKLPFNSNMQRHSKARNNDVKMEKQSLQQSSSYRSPSNVYPKIKCVVKVRPNSKEKIS